MRGVTESKLLTTCQKLFPEKHIETIDQLISAAHEMAKETARASLPSEPPAVKPPRHIQPRASVEARQAFLKLVQKAKMENPELYPSREGVSILSLYREATEVKLLAACRTLFPKKNIATTQELIAAAQLIPDQILENLPFPEKIGRTPINTRPVTDDMRRAFIIALFHSGKTIKEAQEAAGLRDLTLDRICRGGSVSRETFETAIGGLGQHGVRSAADLLEYAKGLRAPDHEEFCRYANSKNLAPKKYLDDWKTVRNHAVPPLSEEMGR